MSDAEIAEPKVVTKNVFDLPDEIEIDGEIVARFSEVRAGRLTLAEIDALLARVRAARKAIDEPLTQDSSDEERARVDRAMRDVGKRIFWLQYERGQLARTTAAREREKALENAARQCKEIPAARMDKGATKRQAKIDAANARLLLEQITKEESELTDDIKDRDGRVLGRFSDIRSNIVSVDAIKALLSLLDEDKRRLVVERASLLDQKKVTESAIAHARVGLRRQQITMLNAEINRLKTGREERVVAAALHGDGLDPGVEYDIPDEILDREGEVLARFSDIRAGVVTGEQIRALIVRLTGERTAIGEQLRDARERKDFTNEPNDPDWIRRAQNAHRLKESQIKQLQLELDRNKRVQALLNGIKPTISIEEEGQLKTPEMVRETIDRLQRQKNEITAKIAGENLAESEVGAKPDRGWKLVAERTVSNLGRKIALLKQMLARMTGDDSLQGLSSGELRRRNQELHAQTFGSKKRRTAAFEQHFIDVAEEWLGPDLFGAIKDEAKQRTEKTLAESSKPEES